MNWRTILPKKFSHFSKHSKVHNRFPNLGIQQRDWEPPGNLTLKASGIWLQNFQNAEETEILGGYKQNLLHTGTQEKGVLIPQETEPDLPVSVQESWVEAWVDSGLPWGQGHWIQQCRHKLFWRRSPLPLPWFGIKPNYRKETQQHPWAENWIKDLLSMSLPTRARPSFPHSQSIPSGSFHKPLIRIHLRADRMKTTITEN